MSAQVVVITRYPANRGAAWLREAYAMLSRARLRWLGLLALYYLIMALIELTPWLGKIAMFVLKPIFTVGFLAAAWAQERGELPQPRHLFQGFRSNLWALVPLGLFLLVGVMLSLLATVLVDDGKLLDVLSGQTKLDEETVASGDLQGAMLFSAACALPLLLAMWYAPALVVFHDCSAWRALALSLKATLANWRPFTVYGLFLLFYGLVLPVFAMTLLALLLPKSVALPAALLLVMPYFFLLFATLHISDYVSYRDIFHAHEQPAQHTHTATG
jgi:hypothetical protein